MPENDTAIRETDGDDSEEREERDPEDGGHEREGGTRLILGQNYMGGPSARTLSDSSSSSLFTVSAQAEVIMMRRENMLCVESSLIMRGTHRRK